MKAPNAGVREAGWLPVRADREGRWRGGMVFCLRLLLVLGLLAAGLTAQARKFSRMTPQGQWQTVNENQYKPRRSGEPLIVTANGLTINVEFQDADGEGFNDVVQGSLRRDAVRHVILDLAWLLDYPGGTLDVVFEPSGNENFGYLASGGTYFPEPTAQSGFYNGFAFQHLNSMADPSGSLPDLYCSVNFGYPIYAGTGNPSYEEYDLISLLLHEFMHGLGIISLVDQNGNSTISEGNPGIFSGWDELLVMGETFSNLWAEGGTFVGNPSSLAGNTPGVFFDGSYCRALLGVRPRVYTPDYFALDNSLSHWFPGLVPGAVMTPNQDTGYKLRVLADLEKAALKDLGWRLWEPPVDAVRGHWDLYR